MTTIQPAILFCLLFDYTFVQLKYGGYMSNYIGYKQSDNERRKANNLTDQLPLGPNQNVKCYSTKPGQDSAKTQAQKEASKYRRLNRKQPVKHITDPVVIAEIEAQYKKAA